MENKNQRSEVKAGQQQKPGFGTNSQTQTNVRAPQGSQTSGTQKASPSQSEQSQKSAISGSQKSALDNSRRDENLDEEDSFKSSKGSKDLSRDSRKI